MEERSLALAAMCVGGSAGVRDDQAVDITGPIAAGIDRWASANEAAGQDAD